MFLGSQQRALRHGKESSEEDAWRTPQHDFGRKQCRENLLGVGNSDGYTIGGESSIQCGEVRHNGGKINGRTRSVTFLGYRPFDPEWIE